MPLVEGLGIAAVQLVQADRQEVDVGRDDQVVVVRHQAEGVAVPARAVDDLRKEREEEAAVVIVLRDRAARGAAGCDVEDAVLGEKVPREPRHPATLAVPGERVAAVHG